MGNNNDDLSIKKRTFLPETYTSRNHDLVTKNRILYIKKKRWKNELTSPVIDAKWHHVPIFATASLLNQTFLAIMSSFYCYQ